MSTILTARMKAKLLLLLVSLVASSQAFCATPAEKLYASVEQHLQSLKTLEIRYEALGAAFPEGGLEGRMIWVKPDRYYHDTPEWTVCEVGNSGWRYLKKQNTLILEPTQDKSALLPENVLFTMRKDVKAETLEEGEGGRRVLTLKSSHPESAAMMTMELPAGSLKPEIIAFTTADGSQVRYKIRQWNEGTSVDSALFSAPEVPAENRIDFREAGKGKE
jgi:outer membrane lipoprotein-sorting protein